MNPWFDFFIVICVQALVLLFVAYQKRAFRELTPNILCKAAIAGIVLGGGFDLLIGKSLGAFGYALGFAPLFLLLNGAFSYGIWLATIYVLRSERLLPFFFWTIAVGIAYECADQFFPVWGWVSAGNFLLREGIVLVGAYFGLALPIAFVARMRFLS